MEKTSKIALRKKRKAVSGGTETANQRRKEIRVISCFLVKAITVPLNKKNYLLLIPCYSCICGPASLFPFRLKNTNFYTNNKKTKTNTFIKIKSIGYILVQFFIPQQKQPLSPKTRGMERTLLPAWYNFLYQTGSKLLAPGPVQQSSGQENLPMPL